MSETATPAAPEKRTFTGSCHCGAVRYEADAVIDAVVSCNCSICSRNGSLLAFTGEEDFRLIEGTEALRDYRFNKHVIGHMFCATCGIEPFARGVRPDGVRMVALNVRCLEGVDVENLPVHKYDGRSV